MSIRSQFPLIFELDAKNRVYLDSASTAQKSNLVIDSISEFYRKKSFPVDRSTYQESVFTENIIKNCKERILRHFNLNEQLYDLIFCSGATDASNIIYRGWCDKNLPKTKKILLTGFEHNASIAPAFFAGSDSWKFEFFPITFFKSNYTGGFDFTASSAFAMLTIDSNIFGSLWADDYSNLIEFSRYFQNQDGVIAIDGAQAVGHSKIDLSVLNPDFFFFSGHKIGGPDGIGVLIAKKNRIEEFLPLKFGSNSLIFRPDGQVFWNKNKISFIQAGSQNNAGIFGLSTAFDWIESNVDFKKYKNFSKDLYATAAQHLSNYSHVEILNPISDSNSGIKHLISFKSGLIPSHDIADLLAKDGVLVRAGRMCADMAINKLGVSDCVRLSFFHYTREQDILRFCESFSKIESFFKKNL